MQAAIARGLAYAPFADMLWVETSTPDLAEAQEFADAIHAKFPGKLLAYNCSPSFNWKRHLDDATIAEFQARVASEGHLLGALSMAALGQGVAYMCARLSGTCLSKRGRMADLAVLHIDSGAHVLNYVRFL